MKWRIRSTWVFWVLAPAVFNLLLWKFFVLPKENLKHSLEETADIVKKVPQFTALISESRQVLNDWNERRLLSTDSSSIEKDIQSLARINGVTIISRSLMAGPAPKNSQLKFQADGNFNQLGEWISAIEARPNNQVKGWRLSTRPDLVGKDFLEIEVELLTPRAVSTNNGILLEESLGWARTLNEAASGYSGTFGRDPLEALIDFQGNVTNPTGLRPWRKTDELTLQGIIDISKGKKALINDRFYSTGDKVGSYVVAQIQPDGVLLEENDRTIFLPLYSEN